MLHSINKLIQVGSVAHLLSIVARRSDPSFLSCARRSGGRQTFKTTYKAVQGRDMQLLEDCNKGGKLLFDCYKYDLKLN